MWVLFAGDEATTVWLGLRHPPIDSPIVGNKPLAALWPKERKWLACQCHHVVREPWAPASASKSRCCRINFGQDKAARRDKVSSALPDTSFLLHLSKCSAREKMATRTERASLILQNSCHPENAIRTLRYAFTFRDFRILAHGTGRGGWCVPRHPSVGICR